jgi:hypothetical protein
MYSIIRATPPSSRLLRGEKRRGKAQEGGRGGEDEPERIIEVNDVLLGVEFITPTRPSSLTLCLFPLLLTLMPLVPLVLLVVVIQS